MKMPISLAIVLSIHAQMAQAHDPFVDALLPCLEQIVAPPNEPRFQVVLEQGWTATLFEIARQDGGGLGTDLCGDLGAGALESTGVRSWPDSLGALKPVPVGLATPDFFDRMIANARSESARRLPVQRITLTALPEQGAVLARVQFQQVEADSGSATVDLDGAGNVIARDDRVPDSFPRQIESDQLSGAAVETLPPPTVDPEQAVAILLGHTQAEADAKVLRLTLTDFDAGLVYQSSTTTAVARTGFDYLSDRKPSNLVDEAYDLPDVFKPCAMTIAQAKSAVTNVTRQKRYQAVARRLQYLLLECSADKPKPHWFLSTMEPFERFNLPAQY